MTQREEGAQDPVISTTAVYDDRPHEFARNWDALPSREHDLVEQLLAHVPVDGVVLDVGSGSGRDLARIRATGRRGVGVDRSQGLARIASARCTVVIADARALPLADDVVDGVLALASLLHLSRSDLPIALGEIARVLRPGGYFATALKAGSGEYTDEAGRHFTLWDADSLDEALLRAGMRVIHTSTDADQLGQPVPWIQRVAHV